MTPEELKEIEDRASKASPTFALDFMKREDFDYMNRGRSDVYKLLNYIKELESQIPRWIPVEERLPEEGVEVIVYSKSMGVVPDISYVKGLWLWEAGIVKNVTHWHPLPKGPEE